MAYVPPDPGAAAAAAQGPPPPPPPNQQNTGLDEFDVQLERTRARTGLAAVIVGDAVICAAAILGVFEVGSSTTRGSTVVAILTAAFTAVGTLTTAYFGIKAIANTAHTSITNSGSSGPGNGQDPGGNG